MSLLHPPLGLSHFTMPGREHYPREENCYSVCWNPFLCLLAKLQTQLLSFLFKIYFNINIKRETLRWVEYFLSQAVEVIRSPWEKIYIYLLKSFFFNSKGLKHLFATINVTSSYGEHMYNSENYFLQEVTYVYVLCSTFVHAVLPRSLLIFNNLSLYIHYLFS